MAGLSLGFSDDNKFIKKDDVIMFNVPEVKTYCDALKKNLSLDDVLQNEIFLPEWDTFDISDEDENIEVSPLSQHPYDETFNKDVKLGKKSKYLIKYKLRAKEKDQKELVKKMRIKKKHRIYLDRNWERSLKKSSDSSNDEPQETVPNDIKDNLSEDINEFEVPYNEKAIRERVQSQA